MDASRCIVAQESEIKKWKQEDCSYKFPLPFRNPPTYNSQAILSAMSAELTVDMSSTNQQERTVYWME